MGDIENLVVRLVETLGGPGIAIAIALENLFPPIPSEVILPLAGFAASRGEVSLGAAILWATTGSVAGALALYGLGAGLGRDRLRAVVARVPLMKITDVDRAEAWFARYGSAAVLLGRMVPIVRSLISVPAGVARMSLGRFVAYTTLGSLLWNTIFIVAGYLLGESWPVVERTVGVYSRAVAVGAVLAVAALIAVRVRAAVVARRGRDGSHRAP